MYIYSNEYDRKNPLYKYIDEEHGVAGGGYYSRAKAEKVLKKKYKNYKNRVKIMIKIERKVFSKTKASRSEIEKEYRICLNKGDISRGFVVNGQILGVDAQRTEDFIFWCCEMAKEAI